MGPGRHPDILVPTAKAGVIVRSRSNPEPTHQFRPNADGDGSVWTGTLLVLLLKSYRAIDSTA